MSKPPSRPSLNLGVGINNGGGASSDSNSSTASSSSSRRKNLNLQIGGGGLGGSLPTRPRSPAPFTFPLASSSEEEFRNTHAETDAKFNEIMSNAGKLTIDGQTYVTRIEDLEDLGELGNGTCGHVVRMRHRPSGKIIAVKQMRKSGNRDENKRIIMDLEVVLKSHDCPYIVQCLGCFITDSDVWICMELMATCMDKLIKKLKEPLPEYIIGKVAVATLNALHYLKECHGVIHRDVKPSNILLDDKGNVKLCDFGISGRLVDSKAKTRSAGCTAYMAPERIDPPDPSRPNYDIRADVWSLGITLVELATGRFPYGDCTTEFEVMTRILEHDPPTLPSGKYSSEFHQFVKQCLIKNYKQRPKYKTLLDQSFIKISEAKKIDICTWYNVVCGSTTPSAMMGNRRQLQSPSAASLNHFYLPSSGSSSVGRHTSRLRSSPSPSSASSMLSFVNNSSVPNNGSGSHHHRLGSAGSSTSSSSGYYSSMISPRTPIRTTPSPINGRPSRYEEFILPGNGRNNSSNSQYYPQQQQQYQQHRTTFDRLNSEPLPNVRSPQTPHSPVPGSVIIPPDPPPRANRHGSTDSYHSNSATSTPVSVSNNMASFVHGSLSTNNIGRRSRSSSPMSPSPKNDILLSRVTAAAASSSSSSYTNSSNPINSATSSAGSGDMPPGSPPNGIPPPSSQSLRRLQKILLCYPGC